jgi:hypothetical protein
MRPTEVQEHSRTTRLAVTYRGSSQLVKPFPSVGRYASAVTTRIKSKPGAVNLLCPRWPGIDQDGGREPAPVTVAPLATTGAPPSSFAVVSFLPAALTLGFYTRTGDADAKETTTINLYIRHGTKPLHPPFKRGNEGDCPFLGSVNKHTIFVDTA